MCVVFFQLDDISSGLSAKGDATTRPMTPNILIMMADDKGIGDTSAYLNVQLSPGSPPVEKTLRTPNLKRFTKSAIVFTDGYAPASMCSATRYSLLTGRFAHRSYLQYQGWLPHGPNTPMIQKGLTTLPEMLQANGYHTAGIGKYHVGMAFDNGQGKPAEDFFFDDVDFTKPILDDPTQSRLNTTKLHETMLNYQFEAHSASNFAWASHDISWCELTFRCL